MVVFRSALEMQQWALEQRQAGRRLGVVPTMGYLHEGHLSLVRAAKELCDSVVVTIFVNPTQFGVGEDLERYPRSEERDLELCRGLEVAAVFMPPVDEVYAGDASTVVREGVLSQEFCGARRPGHFDGVCTVVAKLFNITQPHVAVFGQKDYQQAAVIRRMVRDLNFPIEVVVAPIVREADGLAMSSRNTYLSATERKQALGVSRALKAAAEQVAGAGRVVAEGLKSQIAGELTACGLQVDYVEVVDRDTLERVEMAQSGCVVLVAVFCGQTRLIDNWVM